MPAWRGTGPPAVGGDRPTVRLNAMLADVDFECPPGTRLWHAQRRKAPINRTEFQFEFRLSLNSQ
jgi:hypothetical protein